MNNNPYQDAIKQYQSIENKSRIEDASPHQIIALLFQGAKGHINQAKGHMQQHNMKEKGLHISKTISILDGLKSALDHEKGGKIANNLERLYDYIQSILLKANLKNQESLLDESYQLIQQISEAWEQMKIPKQ